MYERSKLRAHYFLCKGIVSPTTTRHPCAMRRLKCSRPWFLSQDGTWRVNEHTSKAGTRRPRGVRGGHRKLGTRRPRNVQRLARNLGFEQRSLLRPNRTMRFFTPAKALFPRNHTERERINPAITGMYRHYILSCNQHFFALKNALLSAKKILIRYHISTFV